MTEAEMNTLRNGRVPWEEVFPNGSVATWLCGHLIHVNAPDEIGSVRWSKSFPVSMCDNRKYGQNSHAIKRQGVWHDLIPNGMHGGYFWRKRA